MIHKLWRTCGWKFYSGIWFVNEIGIWYVKFYVFDDFLSLVSNRRSIQTSVCLISPFFVVSIHRGGAKFSLLMFLLLFPWATRTIWIHNLPIVSLFSRYFRIPSKPTRPIWSSTSSLSSMEPFSLRKTVKTTKFRQVCWSLSMGALLCYQYMICYFVTSWWNCNWQKDFETLF